MANMEKAPKRLFFSASFVISAAEVFDVARMIKKRTVVRGKDIICPRFFVLRLFPFSQMQEERLRGIMVVIFCFYHRKAFFIPQKFFFYLCIAISFAREEN